MFIYVFMYAYNYISNQTISGTAPALLAAALPKSGGQGTLVFGYVYVVRASSVMSY